MINPAEVAQIQDYKFNSNIDKLQNMQNLTGDKKKQMDAAKDFEAVFVTKMLDIIDSTVDREGGFLGKGKAAETFKPFYHQAMAQEIVNNPDSSFGLAKQMYEQMEQRK
jgi:Rod binding domain-containing protein